MHNPHEPDIEELRAELRAAHFAIMQTIHDDRKKEHFIKTFARKMHPKNLHQLSTAHVWAAVVLILLVTPVSLGISQIQTSKSANNQLIDSLAQVQGVAPKPEIKAESLTDALSQIQERDANIPRGRVDVSVSVPVESVQATSKTSDSKATESTSANTSVQSTVEAKKTKKPTGDGLEVKYKKLNGVKTFYIREAGYMIDTNTGKKLRRVKPGERMFVSHIVVRGKRAPNGKLFGYFYWVHYRKGIGKVDRGVRVDKAFEIKRGTSVRNHLPLTNQKTRPTGSCTASRVWHKGMDNRVVKAVQRYQFETGRQVQFSTTYRTYSEQVCLKRKFGSGAATPGTSNHEKGLAVDFARGFYGGHNNTLWRKYGLWPSVSGEAWHFVPLGIRG